MQLFIGKLQTNCTKTCLNKMLNFMPKITLKLTYEHLYVEKFFRLASARHKGEGKRKGEGGGEGREGRGRGEEGRGKGRDRKEVLGWEGKRKGPFLAVKWGDLKFCFMVLGGVDGRPWHKLGGLAH
jgi:hypothetical protein